MDAVVFDLGFSGDMTIANALLGLRSGGNTNFEAALQAAIERLAVLDPDRSDENFVAFLSDGLGMGDFADEVLTLETDFGAIIEAVGAGSADDLDLLDDIDTDGQVLLLSRDGIDPSFVGLPNRTGEVTRVELAVNGRIVPEVGIDDLVFTGDAFTLAANVDMLARFAGDRNSLVATVTFSDGQILRTALDIIGTLPRSTDFVL
jgi:hypothetical protein